MNAQIEATAKARGISADALRREASDRLLARMTPGHRAAVLLRESRRATLRESSRTPRPARSKPTTSGKAEGLTAQLEDAFRQGGMSAEAAKTAALGRGAPAGAGSLLEVGRRDLGLGETQARTFARGRGVHEAATDGSGFKATDYAYTPDLEDPSTWKLLLVLQPGDGALGAYDPDLVRAAAAALAVPEWGAPQVEIAAAHVAAVKQAIRGAWVQAGLPVSELPPALAEEALRQAFMGMGLSEQAASVAAKGRAQR